MAGTFKHKSRLNRHALVPSEDPVMPASRPIWKGQLRLSLVSIAVELFPATKSNAKPSFRQIHEPTGKVINYEKVVAGVGPVDKDEIMKGFEYAKGDYVLLTDKEIDAVKLETRKTLDSLSSSAPATSTRSITISPITSSLPTIWPRMPSASSVTPCGRARRSGSGNWPSAARNTSSPSVPPARASYSKRSTTRLKSARRTATSPRSAARRPMKTCSKSLPL
jgi:hypothetical protein